MSTPLRLPASPSLTSSSRRSLARRAPRAGEGSRTLVFSLEGYCSTIELHPPESLRLFVTRAVACRVAARVADRASVSPDIDSVGGAGFEPAKALPSDLQSDPFDRSGNPPLLVTRSPARIARQSSSRDASSSPRLTVAVLFVIRDRLLDGPSCEVAQELAEGLEPTTC